MSALQIWPDEASAEVGSTAGYVTRKDRRHNNPKLAVQIRGRLHQTLNWSLGGLLIGDYDGVLQPGDVFDIDRVGLAGARLWPVMIQGRVVRVGGESGMELAAQFTVLNKVAFDILEGILFRRREYRSVA